MSIVAVAAVLVVVTRVLRPDVFELVHAAALRAALDRTVAGCRQPDDDVRVGGGAGAAKVLLVAVGFDDDWVGEGSCKFSALAIWQVGGVEGGLLGGGDHVPLLLESNGLMSKMSTPCILPRISRRSRPVDCSRSVGMVPGCPPDGRRSCSSLISGPLSVGHSGTSD